MSRSKQIKDEDLEDLIDDEPPTIEPYTILGIEKAATPDEVKQAYRKAALKHHPDKAPSDQKETANTKFQEIAFAFAILSDPLRRKRYDTTGSTSESISADDFNWSSFYSEQFRDTITLETIGTFLKAYKGSDEEKDDVLAAYKRFSGRWDGIYEAVMLSNPLEDEERFRGIIEEGIEKGEIKKYDGYVNETVKAREQRMRNARKEEKEAEREKKKREKKSKKEDEGMGDLAALIRKKQVDRGGFFDHMESKYAPPEVKGKGKKGKGKRGSEDEDGEPSEEAFQAARARLNAKSGGDGEGRKSKRVKR